MTIQAFFFSAAGRQGVNAQEVETLWETDNIEVKFRDNDQVTVKSHKQNKQKIRKDLNIKMKNVFDGLLVSQ